VYFSTTGEVYTATPLFTGSITYLSFTAWIKTSSTEANQYILTQRSISSIVGQYSLQLSNGVLFYWDYDTTQRFNTKASTNLRDGKWHHVAFVKNNLNGYYYVDGVLDGTNNATTLISFSSFPFTIGLNHRDMNFGFDGEIEDVRAYDRVLTESEISVMAKSTGNDFIYNGLLRRFLLTGPYGVVPNSSYPVKDLNGTTTLTPTNNPEYRGSFVGRKRCY